MGETKQPIVIERWNVHHHKDELQVSDFATVWHREHGQLCQAEHRWDGILFHPIRWESRDKAWNWVRKGTIAEIQESLSNLNVGFSLTCFESKHRD